MKKLRVGVIYGGRSGEHEVSIASAAAVVQNLDKQRYEPIPIRIEKDGRWLIADRLPVSSSAAEVIEQSRAHAAPRLSRGGREAHLIAHPGDEQIMTIERGSTPAITGLASTSCFRCCTDRTAKTAPCRDCWSSPTFRTSAPACSRRRSAWTRRWRSWCSRRAGCRR